MPLRFLLTVLLLFCAFPAHAQDSAAPPQPAMPSAEALLKAGAPPKGADPLPGPAMPAKPAVNTPESPKAAALPQSDTAQIPLSAPPPAQVLPSDIIGTLIQIEGVATLRHATDTTEPKNAAEGTSLHLHDIVSTGPNSRALILLMDDTQIIIGHDAVFSVEDYAYDPAQPNKNKARYSLPAGPFKYASGEIGKSGHSDIQLQLPFATLSPQGTIVVGGRIEDQYGIFVPEGRVSVQTGRGRVNVGQGQGTTMFDTNSVPARPGAWSSDRVALAMDPVMLKDMQDARTKMDAVRPKHKDMIGKYAAWQSEQASMPSADQKTRRYVNPNGWFKPKISTPAEPEIPVNKALEKPLEKPVEQAGDKAPLPAAMETAMTPEPSKTELKTEVQQKAKIKEPAPPAAPVAPVQKQPMPQQQQSSAEPLSMKPTVEVIPANGPKSAADFEKLEQKNSTMRRQQVYIRRPSENRPAPKSGL